jgi:hypothetical protein
MKMVVKRERPRKGINQASEAASSHGSRAVPVHNLCFLWKVRWACFENRRQYLQRRPAEQVEVEKLPDFDLGLVVQQQTLLLAELAMAVDCAEGLVVAEAAEVAEVAEVADAAEAVEAADQTLDIGLLGDRNQWPAADFEVLAG